MKTLTRVQLHSVLYLSSFDYGESNCPFARQVSVERIYPYWKEVLSKNGLSTVEPIPKGLFNDRPQDMDDKSLAAFIRHNLAI